MTYGELGVDNVATCSLRIRWSTGERAPGCGARIALCHGCGLRTRVNGAPCGACGGTERPTQVLTAEPARAVDSVVDHAGSIAPPEPMRETVQPRDTEAKHVRDRVVVEGKPQREAPTELLSRDAGRAGAGDVRGSIGVGSRRETKPKAPSKPRAPSKRVKPAAGPEANGLPLFK